ncbi:short-chain fatty acid transporter [Maribacter algarum]|uniref:Short-chain fatty acid transporter n=1 Tax=Maribacter algarum (ex Zhang et al. 2020) TaxID=2578118 RepID=A0A5S3PWH3_9FLAO|nr:TIGR00366 family protein [Maribacter algarum]TMM59359.1 short-chain fatty acid transporter [Maribacter algarum]
MKVTRFIENIFRRFLPSPFTLAVLLTLTTFGFALILTENTSDDNHLFTILSYWENGIWNNDLLVFAYQMMLILVLGHVLVLSRPFEKLILRLTSLVTSSANAALLVALPTMLVSFFNWGLGLVFGAILARKVGEYAQKNTIPINYPLIGACGYVGLMVWHGGISGSAPLKVSESGHIQSLMNDVLSSEALSQLPDTIPTAETVLSMNNLLIFLVVLIAISLLAFRLGKKTKTTSTNLATYRFDSDNEDRPKGAERLDRSPWLSVGFGFLILAAFVLQYSPLMKTMNIVPNMLNLFMLGLALIMHGSIKRFLHAVEEAIGDTAGILIQFPLYFGIMGVMSNSGMINGISDFFVSISSETTLPIFTFFSAGLVNIFVPSGGGQWAVQGPMILESALQLNVPLNKAVMALAYGDQITNMLQPFWALPLLGITKLKAKEILPYSLLFMLVGSCIYLLGLMVF